MTPLINQTKRMIILVMTQRSINTVLLFVTAFFFYLYLVFLHVAKTVFDYSTNFAKDFINETKTKQN